MGYLIGEKLLNSLDVAEKRLEWRAELPTFIDTIKELFDESEIAGSRSRSWATKRQEKCPW